MSSAASDNEARVLVIDDDPFVLKWFARQLNNAGVAEVTSCASARQAMTVLEGAGEPPNLIFLDLQMPEMDGVEFVRYLVAFNYKGGLALISGEDQRILQTAERLARGRNLNVVGALQKPATAEGLQKILGGKFSGVAVSDAQAASAAGGNRFSAEELRHAIVNGQLINYYQPKVETATGKVVGVETLVRWQHPQQGLVVPDEFVPSVEDYGLIEDLTHTVLAGALLQARQWRSAGLDLRLAVNVSMLNLSAIEFPDYVATLAAETGVAASSLVLEVTESRLMQDPIAALDILTRLRLKGVGLSIDDFGTGHSSLAQLRDVPFSELKIDRSFVHGAWRDASLKAIFDASMGLARQLKIAAVAEGVEDRADWNFLRKAKCDLAQGDFIGKAMPADQLAEWINDWHDRDLAA